MTDKKDLKRRVRERMARTQEPYTVALTAILGRVVELRDVTAVAAELGIACKVSAFPGVDVRPALERICEALQATAEDPQTETLRRALFENVGPPEAPWSVTDLHGLVAHVRQFFARARAGIGGVGRQLIAVHVGETPVVGILWAMPASRPPLFVLRGADDFQLPLWSLS